MRDPSIDVRLFGVSTVQSVPIRPAIAVAFAIFALTGCRTYESRPLDADAHLKEWQERSPTVPSVRSFADRLGESGDADAAAFDPTDGLTVAEGELVALVFNPDLRLARLRAGLASATAAHAGRWDDPEFAIDVLRLTESVSNPWIISPGLAFTIPISGRLQAERARADAAAGAELERVAEQEWRVRHEVRLAWLDWSATRLRYDETARLADSMTGLVDSASRLADAGELVRTEATLFSMEQLQRRLELRRIEGDLAVAEQRLRSLMGLSPEAPVELVATLAVEPPVMSEGTVLADRNPSLIRLRHEYEVAEQALRAEIRKQYPDLTIGPLYESEQGESRIGFLGAIPIPILNANAQGIAEAEARRELARAEFETALERLIGEIAETQARAEAIREFRSQLVEQVVPLIDRQLSDARRLLELGEGGSLILLESLVRAHDTKLSLISSRLEEAQSVAALAFLAGPALALEDATASEADEVRP